MKFRVFGLSIGEDVALRRKISQNNLVSSSGINFKAILGVYNIFLKQQNHLHYESNVQHPTI